MKKNGISNGELSTLCLELSMLLHAGVGTGDALSLLAEESDPEYKAMLLDMAEEVDCVAALSDAEGGGLARLRLRPGGGGRAGRKDRGGPVGPVPVL